MKLLCTMILLVAANAVFAQGAGRFLSVVGDVRITGADGTSRAAERGGDLREGDTVLTGANALAQLRMADGAQMSVRSDTEMKLERFSYAGEEDRQSTFLASIVKGGLRVITGLMARQNRAGYSIRTASATMGVRGTHFELVHVPQAQAEVLAGTYNRVYDGVTSIQNSAGVSLLVNRDQTAFVSLRGLDPQIVLPPPAIFGRPTPIPGVVMRQPPVDKGQARAGARDATSVLPPRSIQATPIQTTPILTTPILTSPTTTTTIKLDSSTTLTSPTTTTTTISPTLDTSTTTIKLDTSTTLTSPTTTTISPTLTSPTTTTTTTLTSPTTTTNILTSPTTTTISPTLTSPTIK